MDDQSISSKVKLMEISMLFFGTWSEWLKKIYAIFNNNLNDRKPVWSIRKPLEETNKTFLNSAVMEGEVSWWGNDQVWWIKVFLPFVLFFPEYFCKYISESSHWDVDPSFSAPNRWELHSQTRQSLPVVNGQSWEGHQRLTVFHVSNMK